MSLGPFFRGIKTAYNFYMQRPHVNLGVHRKYISFLQYSLAQGITCTLVKQLNTSPQINGE